jgi:ankyrin repeat protein
MAVKNKIILKLLYIIIFLIFSPGVFSQNGNTSIDTTDYLPYPEGLDYNLMIAASRGYVSEVTRLIKLGADIESKTDEGVTPLMFAVVNNNFDCVKILLSEGADPDIITSSSETPLLAAVKNGHIEIAEILIRNNANINARDASGASPIHYAAIYGNLSMTDMLLYYNSIIDNTTNDGTTPLMSAVWVGYFEVTDLLIQNGADVNKKDNNGFSPFLIAAQNGDTLIMNILRKAGANIYETNNYNYNALCLAIKENNMNAVEYLLHEGNLWYSSENNALNPLSVAIKYRRKNIIELLEKNNRKMPLKISIDQAAISVSAKFTSHDLFTGISIRVKEPLLNAGFVMGCDFKPFDSRVIIQSGELLYYQYIDRRSIVHAGLFKDIDITDRSLDSYWSLSMSLSGAYTFGNHFKGTNVSPRKMLNIVPSVCLKWQKYNIELYVGLDYMKTEFYKIGPIWFRIGCTYNVYFDKVRSPGKVIKWY